MPSSIGLAHIYKVFLGKSNITSGRCGRNIAASGLVLGIGVMIGLALMLYAQFKYNKGLF